MPRYAICLYSILDQWPTFTYKAMRLFQSLPGNGGRSRCNCKTSKKRNPFLALRVNQSLYPKAQEVYKCRELTLNTGIMN